MRGGRESTRSPELPAGSLHRTGSLAPARTPGPGRACSPDPARAPLSRGVRNPREGMGSPRGEGRRGRWGLPQRPRPSGPSRGGSLRRDRCEDLARSSPPFRAEERLALFPPGKGRATSAALLHGGRRRVEPGNLPSEARTGLARPSPREGSAPSGSGPKRRRGSPSSSSGSQRTRAGKSQPRMLGAGQRTAPSRGCPTQAARRAGEDPALDERATFGSRPVLRAGSRAGVPPARDDQATVSLRGGLHEEVARRRTSGGAGSSRGNPAVTRLATTPSAARAHPADAPRGVESSGTEWLPRRRPSWAALLGFFPREQRKTPGLLPWERSREQASGSRSHGTWSASPFRGCPRDPQEAGATDAAVAQGLWPRARAGPGRSGAMTPSRRSPRPPRRVGPSTSAPARGPEAGSAGFGPAPARSPRGACRRLRERSPSGAPRRRDADREANPESSRGGEEREPARVLGDEHVRQRARPAGAQATRPACPPGCQTGRRREGRPERAAERTG